MRTLLTLAVGFWIARELSSQYHRRSFLKTQSRQKRRLETFLKKQGFKESEVVSHTRSIFNI